MFYFLSTITHMDLDYQGKNIVEESPIESLLL
jgi:hypothetical protein